MTTTPVRADKGRFNGSVGHGASRVPAAAPAAGISASTEPAAHPGSGSRPAFHAPEAHEIRRGSVLPGDTYTGLTIYFRDPKTGFERVEWTGELHGEWMAGTDAKDPATSILGRLVMASDGSLPHRAEFRRPSTSVPGATEVKNLTMVGDMNTLRTRALLQS